MPRIKERTSFLMPHYQSKVRQWFGSRRHAKRELSLDMSDADFWRIVRGDEATPDEVHDVEYALKQYGREHNFEGWKEL